jgi:hypothetical protein
MKDNEQTAHSSGEPSAPPQPVPPPILEDEEEDLDVEATSQQLEILAFNLASTQHGMGRDDWQKASKEERDVHRGKARALLFSLENDGVTVRTKSKPALRKAMEHLLMVPAHPAYSLEAEQG